MFNKTISRGIVAIIGLLVILVAGACTQPQPSPSYLTGEEVHNRHATGMESQVGDI